MGMVEKLKSILDWGKRIQFVFQVAVFLFSSSVVATVRAVLSYYTHIPDLWRIPIYLLVAGVSLLFFASIGRRWNSRNRDQSETRGVLEDVMRQGVKAGLYDYMHCRATELINSLDILWHRWNNEGEKLIHPLDGSLDQLKNIMAEGARNLINERRDFMVLYSNHLMVMKSTFPDFDSRTIAGGYPSGREYIEVRSDLVEHADALEKMTKKAWRTYGNDLDS